MRATQICDQKPLKELVVTINASSAGPTKWLHSKRSFRAGATGITFDEHIHAGSWHPDIMETVIVSFRGLLGKFNVRAAKETPTGDVHCLSLLEGVKREDDATVSQMDGWCISEVRRERSINSTCMRAHVFTCHSMPTRNCITDISLKPITDHPRVTMKD